MIIDYKKELEDAAKNMILVHDPDLLIKMTVDMIVEKVRVNHASILIANKDSYLLTVSGGSLGLKIPVGLARIDRENPLIIFFKRLNDKTLFGHRGIAYNEVKKALHSGRIKNELEPLLKHLLHQMDIFEAEVCIPSYFGGDLLGVLLFGKKNNRNKFTTPELNFFIALASNIAMAIRNAQLFKDLQSELDKRNQLFIRTTIALAAAIEAKDRYTHGHTNRVTSLSLRIAEKIMQEDKEAFKENLLEDVHIASLLHDIGKIGIPENILNKEGPLTREERITVEKHPEIGVTILKSIKELDKSLLGVKYHHEKYDGSGYPEGLTGDKIPLIASIISVADSFDAMTTDRPYRARLPRREAEREIQCLKGKQFAPLVTDAFIELCREEKV